MRPLLSMEAGRLLAALAATLLALAALSLAGLGRIGFDKSERTLAGLVTGLLETLLLLSGSMLLLGDDSTVLVHDEVVFHETSRGLVSGLMPDLGARSLKFFVFTSVNMVMTIAGFHVLFYHDRYTLVQEINICEPGPMCLNIPCILQNLFLRIPTGTIP